MKRYAYTGRSRGGRTVRGFVQAETEAAAAIQVREQGYLVTSIKVAKESKPLFKRRPKLKAKNLGIFCRQFAIMLNTGLTLVQALELLESQSDDQAFAEVLHDIRLEVASGVAFTKTLEQNRDVFPHVFIHLVEAGEVTGAMPEVLNRLADYYEREDELRKKISEALMYPGIIVSVSLVMVLILLFVVLPMLIDNFMGMGVEIPSMTISIINGRNWMLKNWYIVLAIIAGIVFAFRAFVKTEKGRFIKDKFLLAIPALGELQKMVIFSRFCRTLSLLLTSGIAMIATLGILERLMDNVVVKQAIQGATRGVERGQGISAPLTEHKVFPTMLVQMVNVGEETGNLEIVLVQLANYYDREVNFAVASFTKLLEPMVMVLLAGVVLFILVSVYLPMMQMVTSI